MMLNLLPAVVLKADEEKERNSMSQRKSKILSLLLAVAMIFTIMPANVFAITGENANGTHTNEECAVCTEDFTNCAFVEKPATCTCESKCAEDAVNADCAVCKEAFADCDFVEESAVTNCIETKGCTLDDGHGVECQVLSPDASVQKTPCSCTNK